jgi:hypothetical protein
MWTKNHVLTTKTPHFYFSCGKVGSFSILGERLQQRHLDLSGN